MPKARTSFSLFHSLAGRITWAPLRYCNGFFAYGEDEHLKTLLENLTKFPHKEAQYLELILCSFKDRDGLPRRRYFNALRMTSGLESLLDSILISMGEIREKCGTGDPQRRVTVVLMDLGSQELAELNNPKVRAKMDVILKDAHLCRVYPFLLTQYAELVPADLIRTFDFSAFLSQPNIEHGRKVFEGLDEVPYNVNRRRVGLVHFAHEDRTIGVHNVSYEASMYKIKTREAAEEEEKIFKQFLDRLS